jgi:hypothetical protein
MPERVGDYYNLMPLDSNQANVPHKSRTFRYQTISYKATHIRTNTICYLKRIMGMTESERKNDTSDPVLFLVCFSRLQVTKFTALRSCRSMEEDCPCQYRSIT